MSASIQTKNGNRNRTLGMALATGAVAALLAYYWLSRAAAQQAQVKPSAVPVVVASQDIPARTLITASMLQVRRAAPDQLPQDVAAEPRLLEGKITTAPIATGQPVRMASVAERSVEMGLAFAIPPGYRAVSVPLDANGSVSTFLKPGDRVDILATFNGGNEQSITRTVLQNVTLLATGSRVSPTPDRPQPAANGQAQGSPEGQKEDSVAAKQAPPNATVLVTPNDAQVLVMACAQGKLQLILRSAEDRQVGFVKPLYSSALTGIRPKSAAAPAPRPVAYHSAPRFAPDVRAFSPLPAPSLNVRPAPVEKPVPPAPTVTVIRGTETKTVTLNQ